MSQNGSKRPTLVADKRYTKPKPAKKTATSKPKKAPKRAKAPRGPKKPKRKSPLILALPFALIRWIFRLVFRLTAVGAIVVGLIVVGMAAYQASQMPDLNEMLDGRAKGSVTLTDRNGQVFAQRGSQFGGTISAKNVSPHLRNAVVATEDKRFYRHFGVSPRGIASAVRINLSEGRGPLSGHGGSTLTQQVAKLLCLGHPYDPSSGQSEAEYEAECREGSISRKLNEMIYAIGLEIKFSKSEILTIYLNRAYMGSGNYGFEAASEYYFGMSASEVGPSESAMMAGLLTAPSRYSPAHNFDRSWARALTVIRLMKDQGFLSEAEAAYASANPPILQQNAITNVAGYFADWVMKAGPSFFTRDTTEDVVIRTTLDPKIQKAAEDAITHIFETKIREGSKAQAAIVVMSADGAVRAMVGGRDLDTAGGFNRATQAMRQTGSAFKPLIYAAALDLGYRYDSTIVDEPLTIDVPGSGPWSPQNYTRKHYGTVTLTEALKKSLNIPAVKLSEAVGRENVRTVASMFGIESDLAAGPSLALGVSETTLLQMTGAFAGILNGGSSVAPYGLVELRLEGDATPLMEQEGGIGERVISQNAAQQLTYMMHQVVESGTGSRAKVAGVEAAGKTGTTNSAKDAWFVGFTADYVAGVWMGYDDNTPLTGVTGGGLPAEIWHEAMARIYAGLEANPLPMIRPSREPVVNTQGSTSAVGTTRREPSNQPNADGLLNVLRGILGINQ
ncbi:MAG: transglycosylase domain-containing protein [Maritimibacter sp.]